MSIANAEKGRKHMPEGNGSEGVGIKLPPGELPGEGSPFFEGKLQEARRGLQDQILNAGVAREDQENLAKKQESESTDSAKRKKGEKGWESKPNPWPWQEKTGQAASPTATKGVSEVKSQRERFRVPFDYETLEGQAKIEEAKARREQEFSPEGQSDYWQKPIEEQRAISKEFLKGSFNREDFSKAERKKVFAQMNDELKNQRLTPEQRKEKAWEEEKARARTLKKKSEEFLKGQFLKDAPVGKAGREKAATETKAKLYPKTAEQIADETADKERAEKAKTAKPVVPPAQEASVPVQQPAAPSAPEQAQSAQEAKSGLTQEARDLLDKLKKGETPAFITSNLERILKENGFDQEDINGKTPDELIAMLDAKAIKTAVPAPDVKDVNPPVPPKVAVLDAVPKPQPPAPEEPIGFQADGQPVAAESAVPAGEPLEDMNLKELREYEDEILAGLPTREQKALRDQAVRETEREKRGMPNKARVKLTREELTRMDIENIRKLLAEKNKPSAVSAEQPAAVGDSGLVTDEAADLLKATGIPAKTRKRNPFSRLVGGVGKGVHEIIYGPPLEQPAVPGEAPVFAPALELTPAETPPAPGPAPGEQPAAVQDSGLVTDDTADLLKATGAPAAAEAGQDTDVQVKIARILAKETAPAPAPAGHPEPATSAVAEQPTAEQPEGEPLPAVEAPPSKETLEVIAPAGGTTGPAAPAAAAEGPAEVSADGQPVAVEAEAPTEQPAVVPTSGEKQSLLQRMRRGVGNLIKRKPAPASAEVPSEPAGEIKSPSARESANLTIAEETAKGMSLQEILDARRQAISTPNLSEEAKRRHQAVINLAEEKITGRITQEQEPSVQEQSPAVSPAAPEDALKEATAEQPAQPPAQPQPAATEVQPVASEGSVVAGETPQPTAEQPEGEKPPAAEAPPQGEPLEAVAPAGGTAEPAPSPAAAAESPATVPAEKLLKEMNLEELKTFRNKLLEGIDFPGEPEEKEEERQALLTRVARMTEQEKTQMPGEAKAKLSLEEEVRMDIRNIGREFARMAEELKKVVPSFAETPAPAVAPAVTEQPAEVKTGEQPPVAETGQDKDITGVGIAEILGRDPTVRPPAPPPPAATGEQQADAVKTGPFEAEPIVSAGQTDGQPTAEQPGGGQPPAAEVPPPPEEALGVVVPTGGTTEPVAAAPVAEQPAEVLAGEQAEEVRIKEPARGLTAEQAQEDFTGAHQAWLAGLGDKNEETFKSTEEGQRLWQAREQAAQATLLKGPVSGFGSAAQPTAPFAPAPVAEQPAAASPTGEQQPVAAESAVPAAEPVKPLDQRVTEVVEEAKVTRSKEMQEKLGVLDNEVARDETLTSEQKQTLQKMLIDARWGQVSSGPRAPEPPPVQPTPAVIEVQPEVAPEEGPVVVGETPESAVVPPVAEQPEVIPQVSTVEDQTPVVSEQPSATEQPAEVLAEQPAVPTSGKKPSLFDRMRNRVGSLVKRKPAPARENFESGVPAEAEPEAKVEVLPVPEEETPQTLHERSVKLNIDGEEAGIAWRQFKRYDKERSLIEGEFLLKTVADTGGDLNLSNGTRLEIHVNNRGVINITGGKGTRLSIYELRELAKAPEVNILLTTRDSEGWKNNSIFYEKESGKAIFRDLEDFAKDPVRNLSVQDALSLLKKSLGQEPEASETSEAPESAVPAEPAGEIKPPSDRESATQTIADETARGMSLQEILDARRQAISTPNLSEETRKRHQAVIDLVRERIAGKTTQAQEPSAPEQSPVVSPAAPEDALKVATPEQLDQMINALTREEIQEYDKGAGKILEQAMADGKTPGEQEAILLEHQREFLERKRDAEK